MLSDYHYLTRACIQTGQWCIEDGGSTQERTLYAIRLSLFNKSMYSNRAMVYRGRRLYSGACIICYQIIII